MSNVDILPFTPDLQRQVVELILDIQRGEFGIPITADQQPDLARIPAYYQVRNGNFWVARAGAEVVGTIALLDIGAQQGALRKMFVRRDFRGSAAGTAMRLLDALLRWSSERGVGEIFLGTTEHFRAAHRFYERNGFSEIAKAELPASFPVMEVDTKFYCRRANP